MKIDLLIVLLMCVTCLTAQNTSPNWLQGNHDEYQSNRINLLQTTTNFNISFDGSASIYFDRNLVLADANRNILITNYAEYDGEKFPQMTDFVLSKVDLTTGEMTALNLDTDRPAFHFNSISRAVMSPQGVYYFALSRQIAGMNFIFSYNLTGGDNNLGSFKYFKMPNGIQVDGLVIVQDTLYASNNIALTAFNLDMTLKWTIPTGFNDGKASNMITTVENGRNVLYYATQNIIYRLDTSNMNSLRYELSKDLNIVRISYLGNGRLVVVTYENSIFSVNVVNGNALKLQIHDSDLGQLKDCSNSMNVQSTSNPRTTYSVLICGKLHGTDSDKYVIGISSDSTNQQFSVIWHLPMHANDLHISATQNDRHFLLATDHGYLVMEIASGKMVLAKQSNIANSSCKIITAINGKFYSVCSDSTTLRVASQPIYN